MQKPSHWLLHLFQQKCMDSLLFPVLFWTATFVLFGWTFDLGDQLVIGDDEGFELLKGGLCAKGFRLYTDIWSDQPPLHTWLLSLVFRAFGPSVFVARCVAGGFGLLLLLATHGWVRSYSDRGTAWLASALLLLSPEVLRLSFSVMLEVPAISLAISAAWAASSWRQTRSPVLILLSVVLMGIALQVKLTAGLLIPSLCVQLAVAELSRTDLSLSGRIWGAVRVLAGWSLGVLGIFYLVALSFPGWSLDTLWFSHAAASQHPEVSLAAKRGFNIFYALRLGPLLWGTALFIGYSLARGRWSEDAHLIVLAFGTLAVHSWHKPFWDYYLLHLDIALVPPTASSFMLLVRQIGRRTNIRLESVLHCFQALVGLLLVFSEFLPQFKDDYRGILEGEKRSGNAIIQELRATSDKSKLLFSTSPLYGFYSEMRILPELAILPRKRFWSHQLSQDSLLLRVQAARPSQVLLDNRFHAQTNWYQWLNKEYALTSKASGVELYKLLEPHIPKE